MARKEAIHHLELSTLILINKEVVALTGESHGYTEEDEARLKSLVEEIEATFNEAEYDEAVIQKTALLVYRIASGQHFHEGNKRTALVAACAFLQMNGRSIDIGNEQLVSVVDKAGIATADFDAVKGVVRKLIRNERKERKQWERTVKYIVESNREFLIYIASEKRA